MLTFLFWNLNGQPLGSMVASLAHEHDVDVLMLAECSLPASELLTELNRGQVRKFTLPDRQSQCDRIVIFLPVASLTA